MIGSKLTKPGMGFLTIARDMGEKLEPGMKALADNAKFAMENGYVALEVAAFPREMGGTPRDFNGETINVDWALANLEEAVEGIKRIEGETGVVVEALCYCANQIGSKLDRDHTDKLIDLAIKAGIPNVVGFIGNVNAEIIAARAAGADTWSGDQRESYFRHQLRQRIAPMVKKANDGGVNYAAEPCSMRGALGSNDYSLSTNWFSNPGEIDIVLEEVPGITMWGDISHARNYRAQNQGDPVARVPVEKMFKKYGPIMVGIHLKDGEDNVEGMDKHWGVGNTFSDNTHTGDLWNAKAPGDGQVDFPHHERCAVKYAPKAMIRSVEMEDLDVKGRAGNETALKEVSKFYQPIIDARGVE
jgi:sugar phosphate isomerase/epimerase